MLIHFPEVRNTVIPDPGYTIFDFDEEGADARVVAWDAKDEDLKNAFKAGVKIHRKNALDVYGPELAGADGTREPIYTRVKRMVHATHYGAQPPALAAKCRVSIADARAFHRNWLFELHPDIGRWMRDIEHELQTTGGVENIFGRRINFFQRGTDAFTSALSWKPQSTVAKVCGIAWTLLDRHIKPLQLILQNHDSIVGQIPNHMVKQTIPEIYKILNEIVVPYDDPLIIPWGMKASRTSWGQCKKVDWHEYLAT